ncbi:MAG TPA: ADP-glyceromanno-heptose 6-epimerase, partial [bacterium]|nr:ADP-glyceromanno-heptose 6-epimerase [bacterium]
AADATLSQAMHALSRGSWPAMPPACLMAAAALPPSMNATRPIILVTGAAGFIGARFVESCRARGLGAVSVDRESHFRDRPEHGGVDFGTIVDRDGLWDWLARPGNLRGVRAIVHLGACARTTEMDRGFLRRNNVEYSQRLWQAAAQAGLPLLYASSAATYGDGALGYDDDPALLARLRPLNPYGESKWLFDCWAAEQARAGHAPPAWAGFKFFNVYGFGERHKGPMASVVLQGFDQVRARGGMRLFQSHRPGIADGQQSRDFIWVQDVVAVLHAALEKAWSGQPVHGLYNLGTGRARSFLDLARAVFAALGAPERIEFIPTPPALREQYQYFTQARMERLRQWGYTAPFTPLEEGVRQTVAQLLRQPAAAVARVP